MTLDYVVVTPARNEAENLPRLADCLGGQTVAPVAWIIVDNGSNDGTLEVADDLSRRYDWVRVEHLEVDGAMARGAPVVRAFNHGLERAGRPDVVVKLDADVSFEAQFFERILRAFEEDPRLGITGGVCLEQVDGRWVAQHGAREHVRGATRAYRFQCLSEILPLEQRMGWDGIDELKAAVRGWTVRTVPEPFYHHRALAEREGTWNMWLVQGEMAHFMGYRFSYLALRAFFRARRDPRAAVMVLGFLRSAALRAPVQRDREALRYLRDQQRLRRLPRRAREATGRV